MSMNEYIYKNQLNNLKNILRTDCSSKNIDIIKSKNKKLNFLEIYNNSLLGSKQKENKYLISEM